LDAAAIGEAADQAFRAAFNGDRETVADRLGDIAERWGPPGIHAAVMGWSAITLKAMTGDGFNDRAEFYALEVTENATGKTTSVDQMYSGPEQQAIQMVTLYGNRDDATSIAMIKTACAGPDYGAGLMVASVTLAAESARSHLEQHAATCRGCNKDHPA
jgi:hypothetical protein